MTTFYVAKNDHRWVTFIPLKTGIIAKGSQNTLSRNTLLGMPGDDSELQVVRDYHGVCMNEKSVVQYNLVGKVNPRGVEKKPCIMTKEDAEFLGSGA